MPRRFVNSYPQKLVNATSTNGLAHITPDRWSFANFPDGCVITTLNRILTNGSLPLVFKESDNSPEKRSLLTNHAIFLRYCPEKRDRCYHSVANDTSARPHELLSLRIKDIKFKLADSTGKQYAEVHLVESKNKPRTVPLIFSLPYVKDWIESHPKGIDQNAFLFPSLADYNFGDQLSENALYKQYTRTYRCSKFAP